MAPGVLDWPCSPVAFKMQNKERSQSRPPQNMMGLKQPLRLRQIKRQSKRNINAMVTISSFFFFAHSILLSNYAQHRLVGAPYSQI